MRLSEIEMKNVLGRILRQVEKRSDQDAVVYIFPGEEPWRWSWSRLWHSATLYAARLLENGIKRGDVCAIIMRHEPNFVPIYLGISIVGALPSVLAYPNPRLHPDKFRLGLVGMSKTSGLDWILTEKELGPTILPLCESSGSGVIKGFHFPIEWKLGESGSASVNGKYEGLGARSQEPFLLQHSSGTTGLQKAVVLSNEAVLGQIDCYAKAIRLVDEDRVVNWLPLYHDMGLIAAYLMPLVTGITQFIISPFDWVVAPVLFLEVVSEHRGTISWLPNFAYNHMANRVQDEDLEGIRLDSLRLLVNCSEPVRKHSHDLFKKRFAPYGMNPCILGASYALAENTFAVTQTEAGKEAVSILLHRDSLLRGKVVPCRNESEGRWCTSSGHVIEGSECRILDEERNIASEDEIGEIAIRSGYMFSGYRKRREDTLSSIHEGWFLTGDMGFLYENELYVIGRKKDLIIVAGKNIFPEDIEDIVSMIPGVLPGRVVAYGTENPDLGTEEIHVIAETNIVDRKKGEVLIRTIIGRCMESDFSIKNVFLVPSRWLIKSSSGKLSRKTNMERIMKGLASTGNNTIFTVEGVGNGGGTSSERPS